MKKRGIKHSIELSLLTILLILFLIFPFVKYSGNVIFEDNKYYYINDTLSEDFSINLTYDNLVYKDAIVTVELDRNGERREYGSMSLENFLGKNASYNLINESYYYNLSGVYSKNVKDFFNYSFYRNGNYSLIFNVPLMNMSETRKYIVK